MAGKGYRRLPGKKRGLFSRNTLWLSADHLLSISNRGYSEDYKRFYFQDIQAVVLHKTETWKLWTLVFGTLTLFYALVLLGWRLWKWDEIIPIVVSIFGIPMLLLLIVNLLRGPSCECYLRTAVQAEPLPSLHRVRPALRAIRMLREQVESVQGVVTRHDLLSQPAEIVPGGLVTLPPGGVQ